MGIDQTEGQQSFIGKPTMLDLGVGVLYFFASHMVIRTMYYIGVDRTSLELTVFFLTVVAAAILAHLLAKQLLRLRAFIEPMLGIPAVSVVAALGAVLALISMLPVVSVSLFYLSGALLGLSCGWIIVIWTSTIHASHPDSSSFFIHPSLAIAVVVYFLFRFASTFSETISQGFLLALPLVSILCILQSYKPAASQEGLDLAENAQALRVLVVVAAAFALGGSIAVSVSGREEDILSSGLNYMVLFELFACALITLCSWIMFRFSQNNASIRPRATALITFCIIYLPMFTFGLLMGGAGIPANAPNALWESNVWVLIIAIFAYDIRDSLYVIKGIAVGLMFEAMCIGQMIAWVSVLNQSSYSLAAAIILTVLYFTSVCRQFFRTPAPKTRAADSKQTATKISAEKNLVAKSKTGTKPESPPEKTSAKNKASEDPVLEASKDEFSELSTYCQQLAQDYGLTRREAEILELIAMGRSAKYIADELVISHNTTRTHIKHVYEKLNIHSKQELLDLVLYGSGML